MIEVADNIRVHNVGMKHYLAFVGLVTAGKRFYNGTDDFIKDMIDKQLQTRYKEMFSGNREQKRKAEKLYKKAYKRMWEGHKKYGKVLQAMVDLFDESKGNTPVEAEEKLALYTNEFVDKFIVVDETMHQV